MYNIIIIIQYICIVGLMIEGWIVFRKWTSRAHAYLFFSIVVNLVNTVGYLFELTAQSGEAYLTALKLSYFGRVWTAFALVLFVTELCGVKMPDIIKITLALFNVVTYIIVLTTPAHELYYKNIEFTMNGDRLIMKHEAGIWHNLYSIMLAVIIVSALTVLFVTWRKQRDKAAKRRLTVVFAAMVTETVFFMFQIFIKTPLTNVYDLTMPGYMIGTLLMLTAILHYDLLGTGELAREFMIDRLSEGIIAVDNFGTVQYFNEPAQKIYPELEISAGNIPAAITEALKNDGNITNDDRIYSVEETDLIRGSEHYGKLYAIIDDTEHYRYMRELEKQKSLADSANQAKSAFLANMSHDIRTPINAVLGMNEMVLRECDDVNILGYSEKIRSAGNTLLGLINDILDFSKIEAGKLDIIPVDYDLTSVLNDLVNMIQPRAEAKGLTFVIKPDADTPKLLHGDEIRLKQIITNILTNAVKYTEKGSVTFAVTYEKCDENSITLKISVTDTGIGIKQEDIPKLFSEFDRIEEERNRSIEGTGLGMSITRRLLAMMNSRLEVKSEYGKGSEFSFAVDQTVVKWEPVGNLEEALRRSLANRKKYRERFTAPNAHILVVDDTPMNLEVFVSLLKKTQVRIDTAESGAQCITLAGKNKYDAIFLDHMMPDKDGIETLKELRALAGCPNIDTPTVCLTANAISGARETYLAAGFDDYLTKPVEPDKLEEMLLRLLPKEKVRSDVSSESTSETAQILPEFVYGIGEINAGEGLRHCGNEEIYLQTLVTYARSAAAQCDEIERYRNSGDINNMTVKIHALKSSSRVIGAMELGTLAEKLEAAGHADDTAFLDAHTDELLTRCRKLGEQLAPLLDNGDLPFISSEELNEAFTLIREFLSVDDFESAMQIIDGLNGYRFPENEKERCEAVKKAALEFDYDAISRLIGE